MTVQLSAYAEIAERDLTQLLAELHGSGIVTLRPGVEQDLPQLVSEVIASGLVLLDTTAGIRAVPEPDPTPQHDVATHISPMAWQRIDS